MANSLTPVVGEAEKALADHPDFDTLVRAAAEYHRILPRLVIKDYWVTRVLRAIAEAPTLHGCVLFKGGTSLSKGWKLIDRFSEDVDLLLTGENFGSAPEEKRAREKLMKELRRTIEENTPLKLPDPDALEKSQWNDAYIRAQYHIMMRVGLPSNPFPMWRADASVMIEAGFRGGPFPQETRPIQSLLGEFIRSDQELVKRLVGSNRDIAPFQMVLLKPERTMAEKLLLLHGALLKPGMEHDVAVRHFYDVSRLWERSREVQASVRDGTMLVLLKDAAAMSNQYFDAGIDLEKLDLRSSPALHPTDEQAGILASRYDDQNERALYYRERPTFPEILLSLSAIKSALPS